MNMPVMQPDTESRTPLHPDHAVRRAPGGGLARLALSLVLMVTACAAVVRLGYGYLHLVRPWDGEGGWDLKLRWTEVQAWFAGLPVYGAIESADYPPASYPLLWPFIGWGNPLHSRWIWAATLACAMLWLGWTLARESPARSRTGLLWFALLPAASYATAACILTGQLTIHVLALLTAGLLVLVRGRGWRDDLLGSAAVIAALVKPTVAVPLVWIAFLVPGRVRPAALIIGGYTALTLFAARFQSASLLELIRGWLAQDAHVSVAQAAVNVQKLLHETGLSAFFLPLALGLLLATGFWVWRHRTVDVWLLLGVTALVARLWTYHRRFDDLLILLPMLALFRLAAAGERNDRNVMMPALLGAALAALLLAPHRLLADSGFGDAFQLAQGTAWLAALGYLLLAAARQRRAVASGAPRADAGVVALRAPMLTGAWTERLRTWMAARAVWMRVCLALPGLVLIPMYAWLAVEHGSPWLWNVTIHESGQYSFGGTILYFSHFLRELPTLIAMALFVLAAYGAVQQPQQRAASRRRGYTFALVGAGLLALIAFSATAATHGTGGALRNLFQYHTRDYLIDYGSHWRYHWLSTLWFGVAVVIVARLAALWLGAPAPAAAERRRPFVLAAWLYFILLTAVFGFSRSSPMPCTLAIRRGRSRRTRW